MNNDIKIGGMNIRMDQNINMKPHWDNDGELATTEVGNKFIIHDVIKYNVNGKDTCFHWDHHKHPMSVGECIEREEQIYFFLGGKSKYGKDKKLISPQGTFNGVVLDHSNVSDLIIGYTLAGRDGLFTSSFHYGESVLVEYTDAMRETGSTPVPVFELSHLDKWCLDDTIKAILAYSSAETVELHLRNYKAVIHKGVGGYYWENMMITGDWKFLERINSIIETEMMEVPTICEDSPFVVSTAWGDEVTIYELLSAATPTGFRKCTIDKRNYIYKSHYDLDLTIFNLYEDAS